MEYKIKCTHGMIAAINHVMANTTAKGGSELKNHSRVVRAMERDVCDVKTDKEGFKSVKTKEGILVLDEDRFEYLEEHVKKILEMGVPGGITVGFEELLAAIEEAKKSTVPEGEKAEPK